MKTAGRRELKMKYIPYDKNNMDFHYADEALPDDSRTVYVVVKIWAICGVNWNTYATGTFGELAAYIGVAEHPDRYWHVRSCGQFPKDSVILAWCEEPAWSSDPGGPHIDENRAEPLRDGYADVGRLVSCWGSEQDIWAAIFDRQEGDQNE